MTEKEINNILNYPIREYENYKIEETERVKTFILNYLIKNKGKAKLFQYTLNQNSFNKYSLSSFKEKLQYCLELNLIVLIKTNKYYLEIEITPSGVIYYNLISSFQNVNEYNYFLNYLYIIKVFLIKARRIIYEITIKTSNYILTFYNSGWGKLCLFTIPLAFTYFGIKYHNESLSENSIIPIVNKDTISKEYKNNKTLNPKVLTYDSLSFKIDTLILKKNK